MLGGVEKIPDDAEVTPGDAEVSVIVTAAQVIADGDRANAAVSIRVLGAATTLDGAADLATAPAAAENPDACWVAASGHADAANLVGPRNPSLAVTLGEASTLAWAVNHGAFVAQENDLAFVPVVSLHDAAADDRPLASPPGGIPHVSAPAANLHGVAAGESRAGAGANFLCADGQASASAKIRGHP